MTTRTLTGPWLTFTPLAPGLDEPALEHLQAQLGVRLPDDYRAFLKHADGAEGWTANDVFVQLWSSAVTLQATLDARAEREIPGLEHVALIGGDGAREMLCLDARANAPVVRLLDITFGSLDDTPWIEPTLTSALQRIERQGFFDDDDA